MFWWVSFRALVSKRIDFTKVYSRNDAVKGYGTHNAARASLGELNTRENLKW